MLITTTSKAATVNAVWTCPNCGKQVLRDYLDLTYSGEPICEKCDTEMELDFTVPTSQTASITTSFDAERYWAVWTCPNCGHQTVWSYLGVALDGGPVCNECDWDMILDFDKPFNDTMKNYLKTVSRL